MDPTPIPSPSLGLSQLSRVYQHINSLVVSQAAHCAYLIAFFSTTTLIGVSADSANYSHLPSPGRGHSPVSRMLSLRSPRRQQRRSRCNEPNNCRIESRNSSSNPSSRFLRLLSTNKLSSIRRRDVRWTGFKTGLVMVHLRCLGLCFGFVRDHHLCQSPILKLGMLLLSTHFHGQGCRHEFPSMGARFQGGPFPLI